MRGQHSDLDPDRPCIVHRQPLNVVRRRGSHVDHRLLRQAEAVQIGPDQCVADPALPRAAFAFDIGRVEPDAGAACHIPGRAAQPRERAGRGALRPVGHAGGELILPNGPPDCEAGVQIPPIAGEQDDGLLHALDRVAEALPVVAFERAAHDNRRSFAAFDCNPSSGCGGGAQEDGKDAGQRGR